MSARAYELMIIVDTDEEDAMVDDVVKRASGWYTDTGGTIASVDKWGKRKFAYEIDHKNDGHYVVIELVGEPLDLAPLERMLNLADEVVRHKLFRLPDHEALRRELVTDEGTVAPVKERPAASSSTSTPPVSDPASSPSETQDDPAPTADVSNSADPETPAAEKTEAEQAPAEAPPEPESETEDQPAAAD